MSVWGTTVTVEVSSAPPDDPNPVWVDISQYVHDGARGGPVTIATGRQNELDTIEPSRLDLTLLNDDGRFTSGNVLSPYYPWWKQSREIRVRETVGSTTFDLFSGYLQVPQVAINTDGLDQVVQVTAVDRLQRLDQQRAFISNLAEYIIYNGGAALRRYWSLNDPSGSRSAQSFPSGLPLLVEGASIGYRVDPGPVLNFGITAGPPGDDGSYVGFTPVMNGTAVLSHNRLAIRTLTESFATGNYVTLVGWYLPDATNPSYQTLLMSDYPTFSNAITFNITSGVWQLTVGSGVNQATLNGPSPRFGFWQLLGAQINTATGDIAMWIDAEVVTGNIGGATTGSLTSLIVDTGSPNTSGGNVQLYIGASTAFTQAMFLAQWQAGYAGLANQTTGQRITTVAQYAGVGPADRMVDAGVALMQAARLGGQTPRQAMNDAAQTEQGRLWANGSGQFVFNDRVAVYDI